MPLTIPRKGPQKPAAKTSATLYVGAVMVAGALSSAAFFPDQTKILLEWLTVIQSHLLVAAGLLVVYLLLERGKASTRLAALTEEVDALSDTARLERIAFEHDPSPLCIINWVCRPDGNFDQRLININQVGMELYEGISREQIIRKWAVAELGRDQASVNQAAQHYKEAKQKDAVVAWDQDYPKFNFDSEVAEMGDTGHRAMSMKVLPLGVARPPDEGDYCLLMLRDRTPEKNALMRLELIMEAAADGFWEWNVQTDKVQFGDKLAKLGYDPKEYRVLMLSPEEQLAAFHPDDLVFVPEFRERILNTGPGDDSFHLERRYRCKNGEYIWMFDKGKVVMRDAKGAPVLVLGAHIDIHQRKTVEEILQKKSLQLDEKNQLLDETNKELNQALKLKSEFLANISHEIRTPLNGILGLGTMLWDTVLDAEQRDSLQHIRECSDGLLLIVNDVLDFSKMGAGKMTLEIIPFDIRGCVRNAVSVMSIRATEKKISLTMEFDDRIPKTFLGDGNRLRQVCINLIGNAVKFTSTGGVKVVVQYLGDEEQSAEAPSPSAEAKSPPRRICRLQFRVEDTGIGMAPEQFSRLFQPFSQIDASIARQFGGTGLGLAISKELICLMQTNHEGINVDSVPGKGSVFSFTLAFPVAESLHSEALTRSEESLEKTKRLTLASTLPINLMLAEDNLVNQKVAIRMLGQLGFAKDQIAVAQNGAEAVKLASQADYHLILMDVQMPVLSGMEATVQIRERQGTIADGGPGIIAMTANVMETDKKLCLEAGMDGHIGKPFKVEVLAEVLERFGRKVLARRSLSNSRVQVAKSVERLVPLQKALALSGELAQ
ncbi:hypothetical protein HKX48_006351 [Thoreauomyces humboldtii]|nr:hypothetical protein HKX48_006351 [Thoreauomyces humboldtii]